MEQKIISSGGGAMGSKIIIAEDEEIISRELKTLLGQAGQRHLPGELLPPSFSLEDKLYRRYFRCSNKAAIEQIRRISE